MTQRAAVTDTRASASPLLAVPSAYLAHLTAARRRAIADGQTLWLRAQTEADPRLPRLSEPVSADDLNHALWVLRSLFGAQSAALEDVTLYGAMGWASVLLRLADEATNARHSAPLLPLPYYALSADELDARDLPSEQEWASQTGRAAPRSKPKAKPKSAPSTTKRGGRAHATPAKPAKSQASERATSAHAAPAASEKATRRGGRRARATAS